MKQEGTMQGDSSDFDAALKSMSKPNVENSQRQNADLQDRDPASVEGAEFLRTLQSENQRLRNLVAYLSVTLLRNRAPDSAASRHDIGSIDVKQLKRALDVLSKQFPGHELLTSRERAVLAHIVNGASSKEAARILTVSPRTIEFHRANILLKLGVRNTAELVRIVLGE